MIFQHSRYQVWGPSQHPYRHNPEDISFASEVFGDSVTNLKQALDWMLAVLYPNAKDSVDTPGDLPAAGNTLNDYRVVLDDGDGKQAGYRWEQREGDAVAQWHKVYDFDWSTDAILSSFLDVTQDQYVHLRGRDERDENGDPIVGDAAGQWVYGGKSAGGNLTLNANSGDGVGANTGFVQVYDDFRPYPGESVELGTTADRWLKLWTDEAQVATMNIQGGRITDSSGGIDFDDENLSTTGTITSGTLTISSGSITDTSGSISLGDENLTTTGTVTANDVQATGAPSTFASGTTIGTITINPSEIRDSSGTISFNDEHLTTTGGITGSTGTFGLVTVEDVVIDNNSVSIGTANTDLLLNANGTGEIVLGHKLLGAVAEFTDRVDVTNELVVDGLTFTGTTISGETGTITVDPGGGQVELDGFASGEPIGASGYPLINNLRKAGVSFIAGATGTIDRASFAFYHGTTAAGNQVVEIWDDNAGEPGNLLGTSDVNTDALVNTTTEIREWIFSTPVNVTSGVKYWATVATQSGTSNVIVSTQNQTASSFDQAYTYTGDGGTSWTTGFGNWLVEFSIVQLAPSTLLSHGSVKPSTNATLDLGASGARWKDLWLSNSITDGTDTMTLATLMTFRDATVGANVGDALFWDGTKWVADHPDTEIDHGEIAGIGDDDHTQYALLAGRPGGQVLIGGDGVAENLDLIGTSNAFYGQVRIGGHLTPLAAHYNLGTGGLPWHDLVMTGEAKGMRLENAANFASLPAASATTPGRMAYLSDETGIVIDAGGNWQRVSTDTFYTEDAVNWDGSTASVSYDVSTTVTNAKKMVWQFKDNTNNYKVLAGAEITHTSDTNVTVTFGIDLPAGTYTLVGR